MNAGIVIVGGGQAGAQAALSLRQEGYGEPIMLIGEEPGLPYQRPPLSKGFLKDGNAARLTLRPAEVFRKLDIELASGVAVRAIDRSARRVETADGRRIGYDHLILATGAVNRRLPLPGIGLDGVLGLRTLADAEHLRERLATAGRLVVIGGGFIGLEVAAVARELGREVCVLEAAGRLMARAVSPPLSHHMRLRFAEMGVDIHLEAAVGAILADGAGRAAAVALADGRRFEADLVLVAAGILPNTALARAAGLEAEHGVQVDAFLRTADPAISAIGDCASFPDAASGRAIRLESVQNAVDQARVLAASLARAPVAYERVAWFWSDQGPHKLQMAGLTADADRTHVDQDPAKGSLRVFCFRGERLIGLETVNAPGDHMRARKLLGEQRVVTRRDLEAVDFDLDALLRLSPPRG